MIYFYASGPGVNDYLKAEQIPATISFRPLTPAMKTVIASNLENPFFLRYPHAGKASTFIPKAVWSIRHDLSVYDLPNLRHLAQSYDPTLGTTIGSIEDPLLYTIGIIRGVEGDTYWTSVPASLTIAMTRSGDLFEYAAITTASTKITETLISEASQIVPEVSIKGTPISLDIIRDLVSILLSPQNVEKRNWVKLIAYRVMKDDKLMGVPEFQALASINPPNKKSTFDFKTLFFDDDPPPTGENLAFYQEQATLHRELSDGLPSPYLYSESAFGVDESERIKSLISDLEELSYKLGKVTDITLNELERLSSENSQDNEDKKSA